MKSRYFYTVLLTLGVILSLGVASPPSEGGSIQNGPECDGWHFIGCVTDRILPHEDFDLQSERRLIVFRVIPPFSSEWEVVIREKPHGAVQAIYYQVDQTQGTISSQIDRILSQDRSAGVEAVARQIRVTVKTIDSAPNDLRLAIDKLYELRAWTDSDNAVLVDATQYELWEDTGTGSLHLTINDGGKPASSNATLPAVAKWMVQVTSLIQAASGQVEHR